MSFFDDEGDEPPTRTMRPRRPAQPRAESGRGSGRGPGPADHQQLMLRRALALGIGVIVLILLVLGVNGCLKSRTKNALRDYNRDVNAIATDSNDQVSKRLFDLLGNSSGSTIGLVNNVNQLREAAGRDLRRAQGLDVPDDMKEAHRHLLVALSLRQEGIEKIAADLAKISGAQKRQAADRIAGSMRLFLASDILFSQRVDPYIKQTLGDHDIGGQDIIGSQFLPDDTWLSAATVGRRLGVSGAGSATSNGSCPNTCGHGLTSVAVGDTTLQPNGVNNRVTIGATTTFTVNFQNQGQSDQFDVLVKIAISASGITTITGQKRVDETKAGQPATTTVRLTKNPPLNRPVRVKVTIAPVPGEKTTSNNTQTYTVTFGQ